MVKRPKFQGQKAQASRERYTESVIVPTDGMGHYGAKPWPFDYRRAVEQAQGWVYRCVMGNAQTAASVPLRLFVRKRSEAQLKALGLGPATYTSRPVTRSRMKYLTGERRDSRPSNAVLHKMSSFGDEFEEVQDHPVLDVLRTVNPMLNGFELATFRHVYLQLTGNAYLHPVMSPTLMRPVELWPMPTDWTRIIPGEPGGTEMVRGYVFGDGYTREQTFESDEVLHFAVNRYIRDAHYGYGPMEAAWSTVGLSVSKRISDKALFDNMSRPDYVLSIEGASADEAQRTDSRINALHRGVRKVGRALVTTGRAKVQPLQFPPKDVGEFAEILEEVAGIFGYPIQKLKSSYEPKANAEIADYGWMKDTILPMLRNDEEALNQGGFLGLFGDGALLDDVVLAYDDPVPANAESQRLDTQAYVTTGVRLINEDREEMGLPPVEGGDVPRINGVAITALDAQAMAQAEAASQPFGVFPPQQQQPFIIPPQAEPEPDPEPTDDVPEVVIDPPQENAENVAEGEKLNGAQITAASDIVKQVTAGQMPDGVAVELLIAVGLSAERAERMVAEALAFVPRPEGDKGVGHKSHKAPAKYDDINFKPTRSMADAAQQGLDYRDEYGRGGTEVGIARARDISNRENLSPDTIGRMVSFFARHADNRNPDAEESDGGPSNGWIAWLLWGGDPGKAWAEKVQAQMERADDEGSDDDDDKRSKAQGGDTDAGDPVDSGGVEEADESGDAAGEDQGAGKACQCCKTYTPDEPEGDIEEAVKKYGPDAAYMPITFKGYPGLKMAADETGDADETVRDGEPETPINRMTRLMADAFKQQEAAVLEALKGMKAKKRTKAPGDDDFMNDPRIDDILASIGVGMLVEAASDALRPMIAAGAQSGADAIGIEVGFDVANPLVEQAARSRSIQLAGDLNKTTLDRLRASLADGLAEGESIPQLSRRVSEQFESFSANRAETIARTESAISYEQGQQAAWRESGVVEGKQWLLAPSPCQFCEAVAKNFADKQTKLNDVFVPKGATIRGTQGGTMNANYRDIDAPALHPNCRCSMTAVLGGEFKSLNDAIQKNDKAAIKKFWDNHGKVSKD